MICFLDRTFCKSDCTNTECFRNFTPALQQRSIEWWKGFGEDLQDQGPPVAWSDFTSMCDFYKAPENK